MGSGVSVKLNTVMIIEIVSLVLQIFVINARVDIVIFVVVLIIRSFTRRLVADLFGVATSPSEVCFPLSRCRLISVVR